MMNVLIVGYGYMGQIRRRVVESMPELRLAGVSDPSVQETDLAGIARFDDYREAIEAVRPALVFVCTPNGLTPDVCVHALERGCHVFAEKPPGRTVADVLRIRAAERARPDLKLMFGFNHRHHPAIQEARAIVRAGRMGRVLWLRGVYGKSGGRGRSFEQSWRNDPGLSGGGILLDQGIHMLDLFRYFCGEFDEVLGMTATGYWRIPVEDNAFVLLRNRQGQMAQLHSSATLWRHTFRLDVGLEGGYLVAEGLLSKTGSYGRERLVIGRRPPDDDDRTAIGSAREELVYFDSDRSWDVQVRDLVTCIMDDRPVSDSSSLDALRVMEIIEAVYAPIGRGIEPSAPQERAR
jgi:predicted dehydrogenase